MILDRRSRASRFCTKFWQRWDERPSAVLRWLAGMTAAITGRAVARRVATRGQPPRFPFILSVGNLRVGGTGKTPVVLALARALAQRGHHGAILTRGYGSTQSGPLLVRADDPTAADEARLLAAELPEWPVVQARDRAAGLGFLTSSPTASLTTFLTTTTRSPRLDLVILEDGFQTARVPRHLDVVILDRWRQEGGLITPETGWVLPWGPYREEATGAARAAIWLVEVDEETALLREMQPKGDREGDSEGGNEGHSEGGREGDGERGREEPSRSVQARSVKWRGHGSTAAVPVLPFRRRLTWSPGMDRSAWPPYGVVSGLARPEPFEHACAQNLGQQPRLVVRYEDHFAYTRHEVKWLLDAGNEAGVEAWLTSGKDWIKLNSHWPAEVPVNVPQLEIDWLNEETLPDLVEERLSQG